jgi:hypothetical protein
MSAKIFLAVILAVLGFGATAQAMPLRVLQAGSIVRVSGECSIRVPHSGCIVIYKAAAEKLAPKAAADRDAAKKLAEEKGTALIFRRAIAP